MRKKYTIIDWISLVGYLFIFGFGFYGRVFGCLFINILTVINILKALALDELDIPETNTALFEAGCGLIIAAMFPWGLAGMAWLFWKALGY
jgi:hypothetical protein